MESARIVRLEASFAELAPRGPELVDRFYALLFARHPELRPLFPRDIATQKQRLLASLGLVVRNLRSPDVLAEPLRELGARHHGYGAKIDQYPAIRDTLIEVMREINGVNWTAELTADWKAALNIVAVLMIEGHSAASAARSPADPRQTSG